ncbi:MAG TPA: hypothetical protein VMX94_05765 [Armatimonadota bacterium]|nr:hypothetical protein [Armatimonadota bacterium]
MTTPGRRRRTRRKTEKKSFIADSSAYREIMDRPADPDEETPDHGAATTEEQLRLYQEAEEQTIREGLV